MQKSKLASPGDEFEIVTFELGPWHLSDHGCSEIRKALKKGRLRWKDDRPPMGGGAGQFSGFIEQAALNHLTGNDNAAWGNLVTGTQAPYVALCTVVPTATSTGATITEATYTSYARAGLSGGAGAPAFWTASASGVAPATISATTSLTGANCTGGSSVIVAVAVVSTTTIGTGNLYGWATVTSTTVSTTQTPPVISSWSVSLT